MNGEIININGITANDNGLILFKKVNIPVCKVHDKQNKKAKIYCHRENWRKYNEMYEKICITSDNTNISVNISNIGNENSYGNESDSGDENN